MERGQSSVERDLLLSVSQFSVQDRDSFRVITPARLHRIPANKLRRMRRVLWLGRQFDTHLRCFQVSGQLWRDQGTGPRSLKFGLPGQGQRQGLGSCFAVVPQSKVSQCPVKFSQVVRPELELQV